MGPWNVWCVLSQVSYGALDVPVKSPPESPIYEQLRTFGYEKNNIHSMHDCGPVWTSELPGW